MELLRILEARIGWWLAYADYCVNATEQLARCQPFWRFVAVILGVVCLVALGGVIIKIMRDRRKGSASCRRAST
jgi:hypothetical protein